MNQTTRHGLPLLAAGQAQKEVTHNEALMAIDRRLQIVVESRKATTPPLAPVAGASYIVPADAAGEWSGQGDRIAGFDGFGWTFDKPQRGWLAWIADERGFSVYDAGWATVAVPVPLLQAGGAKAPGTGAVGISTPSGGEIVDVESRSVLGQLLAALRAQSLIP